MPVPGITGSQARSVRDTGWTRPPGGGNILAFHQVWGHFRGEKTSMPKLYHFALDPFCRRIRLMLGEFGVVTELQEIRPWMPDAAFLELSPFGEVPVFVDDDGTVAAGILAAGEYLEETRRSAERTLYGHNPAERAETRRLLAWAEGRFHADVVAPIYLEKALRRLLPREKGGGPPDTGRVRAASARLKGYLQTLGELADARRWLAGDELSAADLAVAAQLSVLEYLDAIDWSENESAKLWYQRIKSRPSFRPILADRVRGIAPPAVYAALDF
jgi:glutathione S-transferase